jgi:hypothetical protein
VPVALDVVLVVDDVAVDLEVAARDVDVEAVADPHQRFADRRLAAARQLDADLVPDRELLLPDGGDLVAGAVLEHPGVPEAQRLAVHLERLGAGPVLDPVVVADSDQLLAHLEPEGRLLVVPVPSQKPHVLALPWPVPTVA